MVGLVLPTKRRRGVFKMKHVVEVEKGREASDGQPSVGPAYRSVFAKDGFPQPIPGLESCWDVFRMSVEKNPKNRMLGRREFVDGRRVNISG